MSKLPDSAFQMTGKVQVVPTEPPEPDDRRRILYSECSDKAVAAEEKLKGWPSVSYQVARPGSWGFEGFNGVIVAYHMPADDSDGNETFYIGVPTSDWLSGKLGAELARNWVLNNLAPIGWSRLMPVLRVQDFVPVQEQEVDKPSPKESALRSWCLNWLFGRAKPPRSKPSSTKRS